MSSPYSFMQFIIKDYIRGSLNPKRIWEKIKYDLMFRKEYPDYFQPAGFICFTGIQGSGKTLSAVEYIHRILLDFPETVLVTNCYLQFPDWNGTQIRYEGYEQIENLDNGYKGIILFLDEIQIEFNSLDSAKVAPSWFSVICQQRKRRLHVVGTSQLFSRIAKPWREQFTAVIKCKTLFGFIQYNQVLDLDSVEQDVNGNIIKEKSNFGAVYFRDIRSYDYYDTWERQKESVSIK